MPAEPTKAKLKRRSSRKDVADFGFDGTHARELELKRTRGEVSCAECRRLKIKCDKQIPCQSCIRRGCVTLCPNGSLATGQGTRFVLAATEHLHNRIAKLNGRIRQLEDALQSLHSQHSIEPHPLLHKDLLFKDEPEPLEEQDIRDVDDQESAPHPPSDIVNAFGTLSVSDNGVTRFFGPTGGSESLLMSGSDSKSGEPHEAVTPPDAAESQASTLSLFSRSFPFTPVGKPPQIQELIETSHLPTYENAVNYLEIYFAQVGWLFRCVTRAQVLEDMLPVVYKRQPSPDGEEYGGPHDLALLFTMFAVACFVGEDEMKPYSDHYFQIARVALSLRPILEKPSMVTIQALDIQGIYIAMSGGGGVADEGGETSMEATWSMVTLASNLSQTIGLHRDSSKWGLSSKIVQRRSILFWDLFVSDVWQSLNTGRPPSFSLAYVDTPFPKYEDAGNNPAHAFEVWQARFAAQVVMDVAAKTLTTESPSYSTIMALDRSIREFPNPDSMSDSNANFSNSSQRNVLDHVRETVLLYIHRSFFAQAIIEHPENPLKSAYAPSFLAAYKASTTILEAVQDQFERWPRACSAFWTMWTFAFSAAVVFGTVVTRGPRSPLAKTAMRELEKACVLFSKSSPYSVRAARALPVLKKLADKARLALSAAQDDPSGEAGAHWSLKGEDTDDELSIFIGRTRFVNSQRPSEPNSSSETAAGSQDVTPPSAKPPVSSQGPNPGVPSYQASHSQPVTVVDVSMHGAPGWEPASATYEESRPSGYPTGTLDRYQESRMPPSAPHPSQDYAWDQTSAHPQSYTDNPRVEMGRSRQYSINPTAHQAEQYYDSGPSTVPINHRSQSYYPQPTGYGSQAMYGSNPPRASSSRMEDNTTYAPSAPQYHGYQHQQHYQDSYAPRHDEGAYVGYHMYPTTPAFNPGSAAPANPALEEMGIVSRDSRLDQRWSSFVSDTGILDGYNSYR